MNLLVIFVIIIIILQFILFVKTRALISTLRHVLKEDFGLVAGPGATIIKCWYKGENEVTFRIEESINMYLLNNKGAVSDFNLIKDIVERNCDTLEAKINSQTPLPLYLGLMGTVAGIILGLFTIQLNGGFAHIEDGIEPLIEDVATAMIASFMGIGFTTLTLWKAKQGKSMVENNKNVFYTWFQANLLPVISESAVSAITLLQKNLNRFNHSFSKTADRLEEKLQGVGDVYAGQIEILEKLETIDVKKMAMVNVKLLSELDKSMGNIKKFSQYLNSATEYLDAVRELNGKLDQHLERTEALGVVSDFYKNQMKEINLRQDAIRSAVVSVDDVMKSALATLESNSEKGLQSVQQAFLNQMQAMQKMVGEQTKQLAAQMKQMPEMLQQLGKISTMTSKLDQLASRIEKSNKQLADSISASNSHLARHILQPAGNVSAPLAPGKGSFLFRGTILFLFAAVAFTSIFNVIMIIKGYPHIDDSPRNSGSDTTTVEANDSVAVAVDDSVAVEAANDDSCAVQLPQGRFNGEESPMIKPQF